jgi:hypothetical protein
VNYEYMPLMRLDANQIAFLLEDTVLEADPLMLGEAVGKIAVQLPRKPLRQINMTGGEGSGNELAPTDDRYCDLSLGEAAVTHMDHAAMMGRIRVSNCYAAA